jgi:hypothetical protein
MARGKKPTKPAGREIVRSRPTPPAARTVDEIMNEGSLRVTAGLNKSVEGIIDAGRAMLDTHEELKPHHGAWSKFVGTDEAPGVLPVGYRTAYRLMDIGKAAERLLTHVSSLPPSWSTMAELARLPAETFKRGIEGGLINPGMERLEAQLLARPAAQQAVLRGAGLGDAKPVIDMSPAELAPPPAAIEAPAPQSVDHDQDANAAINAILDLARAMKHTDYAAIVAQLDKRADEPLTEDFVREVEKWLATLAGKLRAHRYPEEYAVARAGVRPRAAVTQTLRVVSQMTPEERQAAVARMAAFEAGLKQQAKTQSRREQQERAEAAEAEQERQRQEQAEADAALMRERDRAGKPN